MFSGASDLIKYCINKRKMKNLILVQMRLVVFFVVGYCMEIIQAMEEWAEKRQMNC